MTMIERAKSGDDEAWDRLVEIYGPLVHAQCLRRGLQIADARDVTMEVFRSVWQSLSRFRKDRESDRFLKFLRNITSRRIVDHWRRESVRQDRAHGGGTDWLAENEIADDGELSDEQSESVWNHESLVKALANRILEEAAQKFTERTLSVFKRVIIDEATVKDVAADFEMSESAVRTNVSRIRKWIREGVGELPEELSRFYQDELSDNV